MDIKKVLVIYKTHFDIGFTDFSENVVHTYMEKFVHRTLRFIKGITKLL